MIVPSIHGPPRRGHEHPFLPRLKGNFAMDQPFQRDCLHTELPTLSQWPQADLSHTSIASSVTPSCVAIPSFSSAKARSYLIPDALCVITHMVYHPMASISACNTSNRYLWTQPSHRVHYPSCVSICSSSSPWAAATSHIQMYPSLIAPLHVWIRRGRRWLPTLAFYSNSFSAYIELLRAKASGERTRRIGGS